MINKYHKIAIVSILIVAFSLRCMPYFKSLYLTSTSDSAHHFTIVSVILEKGWINSWPSYYWGPRVQGSMPNSDLVYPLGFHYIVAIACRLTNVSVMSMLEIVPALFAVIGILSMFLLTYELSKNVRIALFSAFFLTVSTSQIASMFHGNWPCQASIGLIPLIMYSILKSSESHRFLMLSSILTAMLIYIYGPVTLSVALPFGILFLFFLFSYRRKIVKNLMLPYLIGLILAFPWVIKATSYQLFTYGLAFGYPIGLLLSSTLGRGLSSTLLIFGWVGAVLALIKLGSWLFKQGQINDFTIFVSICFFFTILLGLSSLLATSYIAVRIRTYYCLPFALTSAYALEKAYGFATRKKTSFYMHQMFPLIVLGIILANPLITAYQYALSQSSIMDDTKYSTLIWIKTNTPKDAVFIAYGWWANDYRYGRALLCWGPAISHRGFIWMNKTNTRFTEVLRDNTYYGKTADYLLVDQSVMQETDWNCSFLEEIYRQEPLVIYKIRK